MFKKKVIFIRKKMKVFLSKWGKKNGGFNFQNWDFNYPFNQITQIYKKIPLQCGISHLISNIQIVIYFVFLVNQAGKNKNRVRERERM